MQIVINDELHVPTINLVEILTLPNCDTPLGYKFSGVRDGPSALISAPSSVVEQVFDRLIKLPTLPWLRGTIYLMSQEIMDAADARILKAAMIDVDFDAAILLPHTDVADTNSDRAGELGYWTTLRLCARLGIIEGRGVPRAPHVSFRIVHDAPLQGAPQ